MDLDENASTLIVNDRLRERDHKIEKGPFTQLQTQLLTMLSSRLPSLALKTGMSSTEVLGRKNFPSLEVANDVAQGGTPTLFLDVRPRPVLEAEDREKLIQQAEEKYSEWCDDLRRLGTIESLDSCSFAYFHDVLFGDGNHTTNEGADTELANERQAVPLHQAIVHASQEQLSTSGSAWGPASSEEIMDCCKFLAHRL